MENEPADIEFQQKMDEIAEEWGKVTDIIARCSFTAEVAFRHVQEAVKAAKEDVAKALVERFMQQETRRLTWRERLRPRWRIFQWLHDALYGEATFLCGERLNLHRGAELEDWVAGLFGRE